MNEIEANSEEKSLQLRKDVELVEDKALKEWRKLKEAPIPLALALDMYTLYLNGYDCQEIFRVNGQRYPLGMIVDAKLRYSWDKRREMQLDLLYGNIQEKVLRVKNEAVSHLSDLLSAAHKIWGDKVKMFLQDGDITQLGSLDPSSIKTYKELLTMLTLLTESQGGKSKEVKVDGTVQHVHTVSEPKKKLKSEVAHDLLKMIEDAEVIDGN